MNEAVKSLCLQILEITENTFELGSDYTDEDAQKVDAALTDIQRLCTNYLNEQQNPQLESVTC